MGSLIDLIKGRKEKIRKASGLSNVMSSAEKKKKGKKKVTPLEELYPDEHMEYIMDDASDSMSFEAYLKKKKNK